jgi:hypothetical protein
MISNVNLRMDMRRNKLKVAKEMSSHREDQNVIAHVNLFTTRLN